MGLIINKKSDWNYIFILFLLGLFTILWMKGCSPNHRYVEYDNIKLGSFYPDVSYQTLGIGEPNIPFDTKLEYYENIVIMLSPSVEVSLGKITVNDIKQAAEWKHKLDDSISLWPKDTYRIATKGGFWFLVNGERILSMSVGPVQTPDKDLYKIKLEGNKKFYNVPLTHEQMLELFGKPSKVFETWHS
jgi:hypothetical protein